MKPDKNIPVLFLITLFLLPLTAQAQSWDYDPYPFLPVEINHLDGELRITETGEAEGDLLYTITFRNNGADSLVFDAPGAEIDRVVVNDQSSNYRIDDDRLIIYLEDLETEPGGEATVQIRYRTVPKFGLHQTARGNFFTSLLPKSTSHWLPVIDHPRVAFTTELMIIHPSGKRVLSNGRQGESNVVSVDEEMTTFISTRPVTPGGLFIALGTFDRAASTTDSGFSVDTDEQVAARFQRRSDPQIHLYTESDDEGAQELIKEAAEAFSSILEKTGRSYPFRDLTLILLEDDFWETRNYGAGVIFLYKNRDNQTEQIRRGLIGQWFGMSVREMNWGEAGAINILGASLYNNLYDGVFEFESGDDAAPYHVFGAGEFSRWRNFLLNEAPEDLSVNVEKISERFLSEGSNVLSWNKLAEAIYENSGLSFFDPVDPGTLEAEKEIIYDYSVRMNWNQDENTVEIRFEADGDYVDELVNVNVKEYTFTGERSHRLTFTGRTDTIVLNVSSGVENVRLSLEDRDDIVLREEKPFEFWIYQLQQDDDPDNRITAASGIAAYSDNPDLQLALRDVMRDVDHPGVYAEILRSLSAITAGATGTDQIFIERTSSSYPTEVRIAAVEALANYNGNDMVISRLRSIIMQTGTAEGEIRSAAIHALYEITEPEAFKNIAESIITRESVLNEVPLILRLLVRHDEREAAVRFADTFLAEGFPYKIRREALDLVLQYDLSESGWENRLPGLLSDRDPRIRYHSAPALSNLRSELRTSLAESKITEEFDERVRRALEKQL
jgi:hypothetical protein